MRLIVLLTVGWLVDAFGFLGHGLVARLTWSLLRSDVRERVRGLLPEGMTFAALNQWPDVVKHRPEWRWTLPLHYARANDDPPRYCRRDFEPLLALPNVLSAVHTFVQRIMAGAEPQWQSLAFVCHLLTDMHMPLHRNPG